MSEVDIQKYRIHAAGGIGEAPSAVPEVSEGSQFSEIIKKSDIMKQLSRPRYPKGYRGCKRFDRCRGEARCVTYGQSGDLYGRDVNCFYRVR